MITGKISLIKNKGKEIAFPVTSAEAVYMPDGKTTVNEQLETKPNKNHIWTMANMGQDVKEAMTGGSVAVVGKNAILTENVVDKQITPEKTNFINNTIDFELERGTINNGVDNNTYVNERLRCRGFIENENKMYILRKNSNFLIGVYTYNGNVYDGVSLGWIDQDVIEIEKGKSLRFSVRKRDNTDITDEEIEIAKNSIEVRYEFLVASNSEVSKLSEAVEKTSNKMTINKVTPERKEYEIGGVGLGNINGYTSRIRTRDFIEVDVGDIVKFNLDKTMFKYGVNLYDENKKWNGIDYGWSNYPEFEIEQKGYLKVALRYNDDRDITNIDTDEIANKPISIVSDFKALIFDELNDIKINMRKNNYFKELETSAFEIGGMTGNGPSHLRNRARLKDFIRMGSGDIVHFNKGDDGFRWGISISNLDGEWDGIDHGWLSQNQFVIEQECLVRLVLRYGDNRDIDETNINELCNKTITIEEDVDNYILEELESLKNKDNDLIKNTAMSSINVEYGRINGASYVFVRIPKVTNDGSRIVPKVVLTSDDGSISGTKCSALDYSRKHNSIFTINAGLFDMEKVEPVGQLIIDGVSLINTPMVDDNGAPISDTECYPLAIDRDWNLTTYPRNVDTSEMLNDGIRYCVTAWGKLVDNFKICTDDINAEIVHNSRKHIRQSIGQFQNGDYCVCSVDMTMGKVQNESGLYYQDLAQIFIDKGVKFAYSLDGGGSTQTVIGKRQLNPIYEGSTGRRVPTVIEFVVE